jgi:hypothetical protein
VSREDAYCDPMRYRITGVRVAARTLAALIFTVAGTAAAAAPSPASDGPVSTTPAVTVAPDASDARSAAEPVPWPVGQDFIGAIDRPGDVDWYWLRGDEIGEPSGAAVAISVVSAGAGCPASAPLLVLLRNPEGKWIRTYVVSTSTSRIPVPDLPSRYYLEVRAADYGCVGLQYKFPGSNPGASGAGGGLVASAVLCRIAHDDRVAVDTRIHRLRRARASVKSTAARRRYTGYLKQQQRKLKLARAEERRTCADA